MLQMEPFLSCECADEDAVLISRPDDAATDETLAKYKGTLAEAVSVSKTALDRAA